MMRERITIHEGKRWQRFLADFGKCGVTGWCLEVMFTSVDSILAGDFRLMGHTSLLMFPIYGLGAFAAPVSAFLDEWLSGIPGLLRAGRERVPALGRILRHGLIYMVLIFTVEYITGTWLKSLGICPWDYSMWPDHVSGVIRLRFAPMWFGTGLLFEQITTGNIWKRSG